MPITDNILLPPDLPQKVYAGLDTQLFRLLCFSCDLTIDGAAEFLNIGRNKVKKYWFNAGFVPPGIIAELMKRFDEIDELAAGATIDNIFDYDPPVISD